MRILLTGGSGDVGTLLANNLTEYGNRVVNIDMSPPRIDVGQYVQGSILDRDLVAKTIQGVDCVVHIAAWHGIHEATKSPEDFHDLNVTGTFNMLEAAVRAGVKKFVFISSTSVDDEFGLYGHTKLLGEAMAKAYAERYDMDVVILRPRAFIPSWNRAVYSKFTEWAAWFMKGAVHINDFCNAIKAAIDLKLDSKCPIYPIDGAYDYTKEDLANWQGHETFAKYYPEYIDLARQYNLDTARKPKVLELGDDMKLPGYQPQYSMRNLLEELRLYGEAGPAAPFLAIRKLQPTGPAVVGGQGH